MSSKNTPCRFVIYFWLKLATISLILITAENAWAGLQITSPAAGTVVTAGSTLMITVSVDSSSNYSAVKVVGENIGSSQVLINPPFQFTMTLPSDVIGLRKITAVGVLGPGQVDFSPPVSIDIETDSIIFQLFVSPAQVIFGYAGDQIPLTVTGVTSDGVQLDLSHSSLIQFQSSDENVAKIIGQRNLTAVLAGSSNTTTLSISYNNSVNTMVPVTVRKTILGDFNGDGIVDQSDLNFLLFSLSFPATGTFDARDINHDGVIDIRDAQALVSLCTKPCAIPNSGSDKAPPTTTATPSSTPNSAGWYNTNTSIMLSSTDNPGGSGVKEVHYSIGTNPEVITVGNSASINLNTEGIFSISYHAVDNAGNIEVSHTINVKIDKLSPSIAISCSNTVLLNSSAAAQINVTDPLSGVSTQSAPNGNNLLDTSTATQQTFTVTAQDNAGNNGTGNCIYHVVDFSISAISPLTINTGGNGSAPININSIDGFNLPVNLSVSGLPTGVTASLSPSSVTPPTNSSASVTVTLSPFVTPTIFTATITGTTSSLNHTANEIVTVIATTSSIANVIGQFLSTGCIDNSGIANALTSKLSAAQSAISSGDSHTALNILSAFVNQVQAQSGKHILTSCTIGGIAGNGATTLLKDATGLSDSLRVSAIANPLMGYVVNSSGVGMAGATISISYNSQVVATATTDITGFYYFATTGILNISSAYTVRVSTFPSGYTYSNPASQPMTWQGTSVTLSDFILSP